jgi:superfamily II DNA or RNA helicase
MITAELRARCASAANSVAASLWDHQREAARGVAAAWSKSPRKSVLLVLPTGGGKTRTGAHAALNAVAAGLCVLWLAHRDELLTQAFDRLTADGVPVDCAGLIRAGRESTNPGAPVQVASVQTLRSWSRDRMPFACRRVLVVIDEAHHATAETYRAIREHYENVYTLGLTATPARADGVGLRAVFDELVAPVTVPELIARGLLVPTDVVGPAKYSKELALDPVEAWKRYADGRQTVAFCASVPEARDLARAFAAASVPAACVDGETSADERKAALAAHRAGELRVVTNVFVLTEGYDDPGLEVCLLARSCSAGGFQQMVGRVRRRGSRPEKRALLIDLRGVVHVHGLPDEPSVYSLDGEGIRRTAAVEAIRTCDECGALFKVQAVCPRCGAEHRAKTREQSVREQAVARVARVASREEKLSTWERMVLAAHGRGYKLGSAAHKFKAIFGHWPDRSYPTAEQVVAQKRRAA